MSNKPLDINDSKVFPEQKPRFKLGSHDLYRSLRHTKKGVNNSFVARSELC